MKGLSGHSSLEVLDITLTHNPELDEIVLNELLHLLNASQAKGPALLVHLPVGEHQVVPLQPDAGVREVVVQLLDVPLLHEPLEKR